MSDRQYIYAPSAVPRTTDGRFLSWLQREFQRVSQAQRQLLQLQVEGVTDHDLLTNKDAADQHPIASITGLTAALAGKADDPHTHVTSDVTGLDAQLALIPATHNDLAGRSGVSDAHDISSITNLQTTLNGKAATVHTHVISDVTGLQTALDGKAATVHGHVISDVTGLQTALDGKAALTDITYERLNTNGDVGTGAGQLAIGNHTHIIGDVTGLQTALDGKAALTDITYERLNTNGDVGTGAGQLAIGNHTHTFSDLPTRVASFEQVVTADQTITTTQANINNLTFSLASSAIVMWTVTAELQIRMNGAQPTVVGYIRAIDTIVETSGGNDTGRTALGAKHQTEGELLTAVVHFSGVVSMSAGSNYVRTKAIKVGLDDSTFVTTALSSRVSVLAVYT